MYIEELTELSYREFINMVATARSKIRYRCKLSQAEAYLLAHETSIEITILQREEDMNYGVPKEARGLSDDIRDPEFVSATWTNYGMSMSSLPTKALR